LNNLIAILDSPDVVKKKIKRAVTDSGTEVRIDDSRPGISNLVQLYALITELPIKDVESQFSGKMYSDFKTELGNVIAEFLEPIQEKYNEIIQDIAYLESVLAQGAENAFYRGRKTLSKVYRKVGFIQPAR
jgi:tryptophanyl-tRNA synthetase